MMLKSLIRLCSGRPIGRIVVLEFRVMYMMIHDVWGAHKLCVSIDVLESQSDTVSGSCTPSTASIDTHDTHTPPQHVTWTGPSPLVTRSFSR